MSNCMRSGKKCKNYHLPMSVESCFGCKNGDRWESMDEADKLDKLESALVSTILTGADCANNTITLNLPAELSPRGLTLGDKVFILIPEKT